MIEILGADHVMFGADKDGLPQGLAYTAFI
jgi:hypothetical protein